MSSVGLYFARNIVDKMVSSVFTRIEIANIYKQAPEYSATKVL